MRRPPCSSLSLPFSSPFLPFRAPGTTAHCAPQRGYTTRADGALRAPTRIHHANRRRTARPDNEDLPCRQTVRHAPNVDSPRGRTMQCAPRPGHQRRNAVQNGPRRWRKRLSYVDPPGVTKSCACQQNARDYHAPLRLPRKATTRIVELPLLVVLQSLYYSY